MQASAITLRSHYAHAMKKRAITKVTPEPGLLPFPCGVDRAVRLRRAEVTTRPDGNFLERSHSGGVD